MQKYRTMAVVEWHCKRCDEDVCYDEQGSPRCGCKTSPSPWEHVRCLNGTGADGFVMFDSGGIRD